MQSDTERRMTLGSLFDGSGGFPLAGALNGITPLWASEIEPYPIAVTRSHFPHMKRLGSVTEIVGSDIDPVDVITFGSPCQDMSVAGKRAGMKHTEKGDEAITRSGLFYEAIRIVRKMRGATNGKYPTFAIWENVPGAFTSNKGEDFRCVLEELARIKDGDVSIPRPADGKWTDAGEIVGNGFSIAWRILDAQYWGVPQRRRRIYLVADFAAGRAGKILFERESVSGHSAQGGEAREGAAADAERSADGGGCTRRMRDFRPAIAFMAGQGAKARSIAAVEDGSPTLKGCPSGLNQAPSVVYPAIALDCRNLCANSISATLQAKENGGHSLNYQNPVVYDTRGNGDGKIAPTLTGDHENRVTDYTSVVCMVTAQTNAEIMEDTSPALLAGHEHSIVAYDSKSSRRYIVRRMTPTECARLQDFLDCWGIPDHKTDMTDEEVMFWSKVRCVHAAANGKEARNFKSRQALIDWYNKLHTDSAEYRMWGNGIALCCAVFVLEGVAKALCNEIA